MTILTGHFIKELPLRLATTTEILFFLANFINTERLRELYYGLVYSQVQYGIMLQGTTNKTRLRLI